MSFLFGRRRKNIPPNSTFKLTQEGREKLQEFSGDPKSQILTALETRGTSDIQEISDASGLSKGQVERLIPQMLRGGYILYVAAGSMAEEME